MLAPGQVVGEKYRLVRLLGAGGMGSVYEAEHLRLGRRYALKLLRHDAAARPRAALRFEREARLLSRLNHENIVSLLDVGHADGQPFLVLELIRGKTLRQELNEVGVRGLDRVLNVAVQVARGLGHAHAAGIVHRDLKPENVMLSAHADGRLLVKVLDFGVARLNDDAGELVTNTGVALGTAAYMSPEQARGESALDAAVDVFALGVIVYEALTGKRPYEGSSYNETLYAILNKPHRSLAQHRPELPEALSAVVERALAKSKAERHASVEAFVTELVRAAGPEFAASLSSVAVKSEFETFDEDAPVSVREASASGSRSAPIGSSKPFRLREALVGAALGVVVTLAVARSSGPENKEPVAATAAPSVSRAAREGEAQAISLAPVVPSPAPAPQPAPAPHTKLTALEPGTRSQASAAAAPGAPAIAALVPSARRSITTAPGAGDRAEPNRVAAASASVPSAAFQAAPERARDVLSGEYLDENPYPEGEVSRAR